MPAGEILASFLAAIIGGGIGAAITSYFQHRRHRKKERDARIYLARVLAFEFERYVLACIAALAKVDQLAGLGGECDYSPSLPDPPTLPQSPAYQWMAGELSERVFAFPQDIEARRRIHAALEDTTPEEEWDAVMTWEVARTGLQAAAIAADLRAAHGIKPRPLRIYHYDAEDYLSDAKAEAEEAGPMSAEAA